MVLSRFLVIVFGLVSLCVSAQESGLSGKLPVIYIATEGSQPVVSREDYVDAQLYLDDMGIEGVEPVGSAENPVALKIRGRGNSSWTYDKKPYKLKFDKKTAILGMPAHKHFVLLAHVPSRELINEHLCFELARRIDMGWVPRQTPVEVVLNGEPIGLYNFSESVKIDKNRIDIYEQEDYNEDISVLDGGWLVEIDNSDEESQIRIDLPGERHPARFTHKTPELLSELQHQWLVNQFTAMTEAIYASDKSSTEWEKYIDITQLAKYYIIQELTGNYDAFVGSTYLHRDLGGKWMFGPLWDSGWTFYYDERRDTFIKEREAMSGARLALHVWIEELLRFPRFLEEIKKQWDIFKVKLPRDLPEYLSGLSARIATAHEINYDIIWPQYKQFGIENVTYHAIIALRSNIDWFDRYISGAVTSIGNVADDGRENAVTATVCGHTVRVATARPMTGLMITDIFGRTVRHIKLSGNEAELSLPPGLHIATVTFGDGTRRSVKLRID